MFALSHFYVFIFVFQLLMTCHFLGCNFTIAMAILFSVHIDDISLPVRSHISLNTNNFRAFTVNTNSSFSSSTNFANFLISLFVSYFFFLHINRWYCRCRCFWRPYYVVFWFISSLLFISISILCCMCILCQLWFEYFYHIRYTVWHFSFWIASFLHFSGR